MGVGAAVGERHELGKGIGTLGTAEEGGMAALTADVGGGRGFRRCGCSGKTGSGSIGDGSRGAAEGRMEGHDALSSFSEPKGDRFVSI